MRLACLILTMAGAGCLSLPGTQVETVDGRRVELALARGGNPAVVFEAGMGGTLEGWGKVFPEVSRQNTAFAYSRAGQGNSADIDAPRDGATVVEALRRVLKEKGVEPPYVLVGHSLGGLYMQWFARRYPNEVAGLVLVDSTHPEQMQGDGAVEFWPAEAKKSLASLPKATRAEFDALDQTGRDVLALPTYAGKVVVLSAQQPMKDMSTPTVRYWNEKRAALVKLYPNASEVWVDSGHVIPLEKPEAIIEGVRAALE